MGRYLHTGHQFYSISLVLSFTFLLFTTHFPLALSSENNLRCPSGHRCHDARGQEREEEGDGVHRHGRVGLGVQVADVGHGLAGPPRVDIVDDPCESKRKSFHSLSRC